MKVNGVERGPTTIRGKWEGEGGEDRRMEGKEKRTIGGKRN